MTSYDRKFLIFGALSMTVAMILGAYGVHGLAGSITAEKQQSWAWAVELQSYHSLALILIALLGIHLRTSKLLMWAGWIFIIGILLFSGTIYLPILGAPAALGKITPTGGMSFMLGWILVALAVWLTPARR
jgi:uncharacterized membrane protein YgdD (TMEM256/DUF423 family)